MEYGWDLFQLTYRNCLSRSLPLQDFFRAQVPCSNFFFFFLGGGGEDLGGGDSTVAVLILTLATI